MSPRILSAALYCMRFSRQRLLQRVVLSLAILAWGAIAFAQTATTTTLIVSPSTSPLSPQTVVTLTATVMAGATPVPKGLVKFCDTSIPAVPACSGLAVVAKEPLQAGGGKDGIADAQIIPGGGSHTYIAVFEGTKTYATSTSAPQTITVLYRTTSSIASSGSVGNYTLTGTVVGIGSFKLGPTGNVSFVDTTIGNFVLGMAPLGSSTIAQSFVNTPVIPVGANPVSAAVGDFNGDGIPDLAVVNRDDDNVSILLGNGSGGFSAATGSPILVGGVPVSIAVGDFNGDGVTDLAVVNNGPNNVTILLGDGSGGFSEATGSPVPVGNHPVAVAVEDFNGDGIPDLAVVNGGTSDVSILLGNGSGGFSEAAGSPIPVGSNPAAVAVGDFNGDGVADLAVVNSGPGNVSILLGNGSGGFSEAAGSPVPVGNDPVAVATGDFNRDGIVDLAVVNGGPNNVSILLGNGSGGFSEAAGSPVPVGSSPVAVAVTDFNGDGIADLAVVNNGPDNVSILLGDGSGAFSEAAGSPIAVGGGPKSIAVADFNGDGVTDLTVTSGDLGNLSTVLNQVIQTATATLTGVSVPGTGTHDVNASYPGDANFDASTSATIPLIASSSTTTLALSATPTTSTYGQPVVLTAILSPSSEGSLTTDGAIVNFTINGNPLGSGTLKSGVATLTTTALPVGVSTLQASFPGDANFQASASSPLSFTVSQATPTITWANPAAITYGTALSATQLNATASVPGTFVYNPASGAVLNAGTQTLNVTFTPIDTINYTTATMSVTLIVNPAATTTTLAVSPSGSPLPTKTAVTLTATVLAGATPVHPGMVTFCDTSLTTLPTPTGAPCASSAVVGTAQLTSTGTAVLKFVPGPGNHSYNAVFAGTTTYVKSNSTAQALTVTGPYATTTAISPTGSEGNYTLTATVAGTGSFSLAPTGSVSFRDTTNSNSVLGTATLGAATLVQHFAKAPGSPITAGSAPLSVAIADFNGDGIVDIAVANINSNDVTILLGNGSGGFTPAPGSPFPVSVGPYSVAVGDFNGDGVADLVTANFYDNTVSILLGNGSGGFTTAPGSPIAAGSEPVSVVVGDFNGDGIPDLAVTNFDSNAVSVLLGNGSGGFTPATGSPVAVGSGPLFMAIGDFNGDGIADLVTANELSNDVTISLGNGSGGFTSAPGSPVAVGTFPLSPAVGDFNGDGIADLAVANYSSNDVSILLGNGSGGFAAAPGSPVAVAGGPNYVAVGDFNGDRITDLVTANLNDNTVSVLLGNGIGGFLEASGSPVAVDGPPAYVAVADLNGDGIADFVTANGDVDNNTVSVLLNQVTQTATAVLTAVSIPGSGTHNVDASYPGDTNFSSSISSTIPLTASPVATTLTLSASPTSSTYGQPVVLTATLSPNSVGDLSTNGQPINFYNGTLLGSGTLASGVATFTTASLPAGVATLQANFAGDANFLPSSSSPLGFIVSQATPTITWANPAAITYGTALSATQLDATASVPGTFVYNPAAGAVLNAGTQTLNVTFTPTDTTNYATATKSVALIVNQAVLAVTANPASRIYGAANPAFTSTITGFVNGDTQASAVTGSPSLTTIATTASPAGTYPITAALGTLTASNYTFTFVSGTLTVTKAVLTVTANNLSRIYGAANPPFTSTITGFVNGDTQASAVTGSPSLTTTATAASPAGTYPVTAALGTLAATNYTFTFVSGTLKVTQAVLAITANDASRAYGVANPAFTSTITGFVNGDTQASAITGSPSLTTTATAASPAGTYPITTAPGTLAAANYTFTFVNGTLTVTKATPGTGGTPPVITTSSLNPAVAGSPIVLTATVPSGATGTASFYDGTTALGTGPISAGKASTTTSALGVGTHPITSVYGGDGNYNGATSAVLSQVVVSVADFTVGSTTGPQLIPPGASATYSIIVSSLNAPFTSSVTMSATNLPPGATYTFSPAAVTPGAAGANTTFTVSVPKQSAALHTWHLAPATLALLLLPFAWLRRGRGSPYRLLLWMLIALGSLGTVTGCGGGGYFSQPEQTYTITVTGTSGSLVRSTAVNLTVE